MAYKWTSWEVCYYELNVYVTGQWLGPIHIVTLDANINKISGSCQVMVQTLPPWGIVVIEIIILT